MQEDNKDFLHSWYLHLMLVVLLLRERLLEDSVKNEENMEIHSSGMQP